MVCAATCWYFWELQVPGSWLPWRVHEGCRNSPDTQCPFLKHNARVFSYFSILIYPQDIGLASLGASDEEIEKLSTVGFQGPRGEFRPFFLCPHGQPCQLLMMSCYTQRGCAW